MKIFRILFTLFFLSACVPTNTPVSATNTSLPTTNTSFPPTDIHPSPTNTLPPPTNTPSPALLGAGFRYSSYGPAYNPGAEYWASVGEQMAAKFASAKPTAIWIVGELDDAGTSLNFACETDDPNIHCGDTDGNEETLTLFDEKGFDVWLQVEPGNASIEELIDIVLGQYKHHPSVVGFGIDVEWYKSTNVPEGKPVTDEEAKRWVAAIRRHNPKYRLFLKHWERDWMPPTERDGIFFIDDSQQFSSLNGMVDEFVYWGKEFAPAPVGFQYGYLDDKFWWKKLQDPPKDIGQALLDKIPNTQGLFWVDFTVLDVFPPK